MNVSIIQMNERVCGKYGKCGKCKKGVEELVKLTPYKVFIWNIPRNVEKAAAGNIFAGGEAKRGVFKGMCHKKRGRFMNRDYDEV
jgi:hypothetical protein